MSDAKRFEDWIIFDAHEFQYPNGDSMSEDALAFLLDLNALRAKWDAIPWEAIEIGRAVLAWGFRQVRHDELAALTKFIDANAPEEEGE